jgi:23S rRNA (guanosine2251-2'-O)-methyltransferase
MAGRKTNQKGRSRDRNRRGGPHDSGHQPAGNSTPSDNSNPWLYGIHPVSAALQNPDRKYTRLVATNSGADAIAEAIPAPTTEISIEIVDRDSIASLLPPGAVHQGVALLATPLPPLAVEDIAEHAAQNSRTLVVALDQVTDPQNVGAVLRSAAAFGAFAVIAPDRNTPDATGALAKAASGAVETVPMVRPNNLVRALEGLKEQGFWVVGLDMEAPVSLPEADLPEKCILALGAEGKGLRRLTRETCDLLVRVPMSGAMESLNVSASAAVALYEWSRQGG